ncbi:hypothetical protein PMZ80_001449 [Knufia obscura]|uniref:Vegetative cell wall protein gp1 n=2 Tax=Knufia TaxID=430999 RepID=A0AAN8I7D4_9EURO|nr:hypothetical protein PMZ80_001449 [Knufia obscura]KAK5955729.1 hypothetical protein OHC33_003370 [Knufia fluminis]
MSYHYGVPPSHYNKFYDSGYETSSPHSSGEYIHYVPSQYDYSTPVKGHRRKTSHTPVSSRSGGWFSPAGSPPPGADRYSYNVSPSKPAYVSFERKRASSSTKPASKPQPRTTRKPSQPVNIYDGDDVYVGDHYVEERQPPRATTTRTSKHGKKPSTDSYFYFGQEQIYEEQPKIRTTRVRRSSTTTKPSPRKEKTSKSAPVATQEDAARAGIPSGYSIKNWDPTEEPIILLGSVFDANSLGKWMYDWTVYQCGASTPMAEMAGDLWLLLIKLAGKMKRAKECVIRIKKGEQREMIYDFIEGGQRLWKQFKQLLKDCEYFMMKAAKKQGSKTLMGKNAGTEFVESIFGRDRYLEDTERLMNRLRVWTMRFDVNCEDILRRPTVRADPF